MYDNIYYFNLEEGLFRQLSGANTCTCPSDTISLTYECTAMGGIGTTWRGSAVNKYCEDSGYF